MANSGCEGEVCHCPRPDENNKVTVVDGDNLIKVCQVAYQNNEIIGPCDCCGLYVMDEFALELPGARQQYCAICAQMVIRDAYTKQDDPCFIFKLLRYQDRTHSTDPVCKKCSLRHGKFPIIEPESGRPFRFHVKHKWFVKLSKLFEEEPGTIPELKAFIETAFELRSYLDGRKRIIQRFIPDITDELSESLVKRRKTLIVESEISIEAFIEWLNSPVEEVPPTPVLEEEEEEEAPLQTSS